MQERTAFERFAISAGYEFVPLAVEFNRFRKDTVRFFTDLGDAAALDVRALQASFIRRLEKRENT